MSDQELVVQVPEGVQYTEAKRSEIIKLGGILHDWETLYKIRSAHTTTNELPLERRRDEINRIIDKYQSDIQENNFRKLQAGGSISFGGADIFDVLDYFKHAYRPSSPKVFMALDIIYDSKNLEWENMVDHGIEAGESDECSFRMHFLAEKILGREIPGRVLTAKIRDELHSLGKNTIEVFNNFREILENPDIITEWQGFEGNITSNFPKWSGYKVNEI